MVERPSKQSSRIARSIRVSIAGELALVKWAIKESFHIAHLILAGTAGALTIMNRPIKETFRIARLARVSIFVSVLGAMAILVPDQFADALKSVVEYSLLQLCMVAASALFASASVALSGQLMIARFTPRLLRAGGFSGWTARHLPITAALLLVIATAFALGQAVHSGMVAGAYKIVWDLCIVAAACGIAASVILMSRFPGAAERMALFGLVSAFVLLFVFAFLPVALPAWLGPLTVIFLWIAAVVWLASALAYRLASTKIPIFICLAAAAVLFSYFDLNDNHVVRHERKTDFVRGAHLSEFEFDQWLMSRTDKHLYEGKNYPVFIVSAEGGGIRAAYFSALVLSSIQDRCPAFAQHIFAISGVSGGSVGAAVFAALVKRLAATGVNDSCPLESSRTGEFQRVAEAVLRHDFFSPLLAALLFPDFVQRFLPWSIESFDRARAFEYALESAWKQETNGDEFAQSFFDLSAGWRGGTVPALVLNTTNVETGMRMVISHLDIYEENEGPLETLLDVNENLTMPLSTAAGLSARFPLVAPAGSILISRGPNGVEKRRYVDGGYFENTGTASIFDLFTALRASSWSESRKVDLYVLRIGSQQALPQYSGKGFGEVLSPIKTLLNTREARGLVAKAQLLTVTMGLNRANRYQRNFGIVEFELQQRAVPLPLGWSVSKIARDEIAAQVNQTFDCSTVEADVVYNSCSREVVLGILKNRNSSPK
ncbi:MAG: hypothetical protein HYX37_01115 [Rhizobiales bacterium]|nr:hypothetical protein [Hyphomicrobiales bacterium]